MYLIIRIEREFKLSRFTLLLVKGLGKPQKTVIFLMAVPLRGGGGVKGFPLRKKGLFWGLFIEFLLIKFRVPLSSRGRGGVRL